VAGTDKALPQGLEAEVEFYVDKVVVVLAISKIPVVHVRVLSMDLQILCKLVVQTALYLID
jgi:hypothetical protein